MKTEIIKNYLTKKIVCSNLSVEQTYDQWDIYRLGKIETNIFSSKLLAFNLTNEECIHLLNILDINKDKYIYKNDFMKFIMQQPKKNNK